MPTHTCTASRIRWNTVAVLAAALLLCCAPLMAEEPPCKIKGGNVKAVYPELARRMKISGVVRLEIQFNPAGAVRESKVLGGNPVLVSAAQQAVKQTKFESADSCIVVFEFKE